MSELYPLRFQPILRRYLWGGRRLESELGKSLDAGNDYAESWEIADRGRDQSVVEFGPLAGVNLGQLVRQEGASLLGKAHPQPRFPLLIKFLDAQHVLSLQVHPDDQRAGQLDPPDFGKTEAWVILDAAPGSYLYAGLKRGFDRAALERELARGTCELCVEKIEPKAGDCLFLPAGAPHALGPGLLVAEIQQSSDVTYRLFDWNRVGADGRPRTLHISEALEAIDYGAEPIRPLEPAPGSSPGMERLVACDKFVLDRWRLAEPQQIGGDNGCHIVMVLSGAVRVAGDPADAPLARGGVMLLPASIGAVEFTPIGDVVLLEVSLP